jgi:hypothetical protein
MKLLPIPLVSLGQIELDDAFQAVFGSDTLSKVHGPSLKFTEWVDNQRTVKFSVDVDNIPLEVRRFFCGKRLRVTSKQNKIKGDKYLEVHNRMKMHFLGSELFVIRPVFKLTYNEASGTTEVTGCVKHIARLPPPLNRIAEAFMMEHSRRELEKFSSVLKTSVGITIGDA